MHITIRGILILLLAAPVITLGTWAGVMLWIAGAYILLCLAVLGLDWQLAGAIKQFEIDRNHDTKLSLGTENSIYLLIRNKTQRVVTF